ncbi:MAG TPA: patatin-like phospholipase family protein [Candidatus Dormibacteraeota bacterium]|nr:patatin-like phospholipase family protein [Candidatus Dormibacteraeota bacterium]
MARPIIRLGSARKPIGLALQGGGSWGAYTWGVLDALLASRSITITQLSGTSAGALNAAVIASALANGSPAQARKALRSFWLSIAAPDAPEVVRSFFGPLERHWRNSMNDWLLASGLISPYRATTLGMHPLREAITAHVDIDAIRSKSAPALFVTVTNVKTGLPRVISNRDMSIDTLLASASLPELFAAVEIDGEHYWDGGYGGNPTLWPMIHSGFGDDLIIVQLLPDRIDDLPTDARSIRRRVGEITFHSSLVAEMQAIHAMRNLTEPTHAPTRLAELRFHRIGPPRLALFDEGNAIERDRAWLELLHTEGIAAGRQFIARHGDDIGVRETLDVGGVYVDSRKPKLKVPASNPRPNVKLAALSHAA